MYLSAKIRLHWLWTTAIASRVVHDLVRPVGLGDDEWSAIDTAANRLERAWAAQDEALVVGCAKDLCESIARVVMTERGGVDTGDDITDLVNAAHKLLGFQPGEGIADDTSTRRLAGSLKTVVFAIAEIRNQHGTGHGRGAPTGITGEHADLAYHAAKLWSRWALRRLEPFIAGNVTALVRDLDGEIFHAGELARRLVAANLPSLDAATQARLGLAVARRAGRGTFTVAQDGVENVNAGDPTVWPPAYVEGLMRGLLFDPNGFLDLGDWPIWGMRQLARLAADVSSGDELLADLAAAIVATSARGRVTSNEKDRAQAAGEAAAIAEAPSTGSRATWETISSALKTGE